jgi:hypothetical protein
VITLKLASVQSRLGSGTLMFFDPRPHEHQRFKLPDSLLEK